MTINQIDELIRMREQERSALRRRQGEAWGRHSYSQAQDRLIEIERELARLQARREKLQGAALARGAGI
jgi:predicted nuclease with TOPRIM domain